VSQKARRKKKVALHTYQNIYLYIYRYVHTDCMYKLTNIATGKEGVKLLCLFLYSIQKYLTV